MAPAIMTGSLARAMAVFISTPSQPSSMATAASEARADTGIDQHGHGRLLDDEFQVPGVQDAIPEPISEASGMTATQPISSSSLAWIGSSLHTPSP